MNPNNPRRRLDGPALDIQRIVARPQPNVPEVAQQPQIADTPAEPIAGGFEYKKPSKRFRLRLPHVKSFNAKKAALILGGLALAALLFFGIKLFLATNRIITRNNTGGAPALAGNIDPTKLRGEGDGRVNILLLGVGDPGHAGANLSDTIMVVSIDPRTKDVAMLSIPRDLYVPIPGYGYGKINSAHAYGEQKKSGEGPILAKKTVEKVLDMPIHYYGRIDFQGFKKAIDAVGGIDIDVKEALYDPEYPCEKNESLSCGFRLSAGQKHMDGSLALKYARCRKGNCGNDFGRAQRQQEVLVALREKTLSLGTLANPSKISSLIDIVGSTARTDLQLSEMKKLADIAKDIDAGKIVNKVLDGETTGLLKFASDPYAGSILIPVEGSGNFGKIQEFVHSIFVDSYLKDENARVEVQNGTGKAGLATTVGTMLKSYNYNVVSMITAPNSNYPVTILYDYTNGKKPFTIKYLETRFGVQAQKATPPTPESAEIVLILGADYRPR